MVLRNRTGWWGESIVVGVFLRMGVGVEALL